MLTNVDLATQVRQHTEVMKMTSALIEVPAVIDEAEVTPPGSGFGRITSDLDRIFSDRYIYLRFKPGNGQPITHVRVKVGKNVR
jgi:hypothetical protein